MKRLMSFLMLLGLIGPIFGVTGCGSNAAPIAVEMAHHSTLPTEMQDAPERVRQAYQYAVANPEPLKNVPCFCGCGPIGHTNNYDCYIKDAPVNGKIVFDEHALGCKICVDITHDVVRMTSEGRAPPEIRRTITTTYGQFGPTNFK
ncbi:MAG: hypothetical protein IT331_13345 [Anaerolineae bacterium]|nr:hypothetical protein [Anaerolineae bacterium]